MFVFFASLLFFALCDKSVIDVPVFLSCDQDDDWRSYSATLDSHRQSSVEYNNGNAKFELRSQRLPLVCAQQDLFLFEWSDTLLAKRWPQDDPWESLVHANRHCVTRGVSNAENNSKCWASMGNPCLYGVVSAMACMATMFALNAKGMSGMADIAATAAHSLTLLLSSSEKVLEFLDWSAWSFTVEDVAQLASWYKPWLDAREAGRLQANIRDAETSLEVDLDVAERPWSPEAPSWRLKETSASHSFALVSSWWWPPGHSAHSDGFLQSVAARKTLSLRIWAFGSHCDIMAEPVSAIALLLTDDFDVHVTWRGTHDNCEYFNGGFWPASRLDKRSVVKAVLDEYIDDRPSRSNTLMKSSAVIPHATLRDRVGFAVAFKAALLQDEEFQNADCGFCSEPAYACLLMHDTGKPVLGYFGVNIDFMFGNMEDQLELYSGFRDSLASDVRSTLATVAPYISIQVLHHVLLEIPAVRPVSSYTLPASYSAKRSQEVLINKRSVVFWDLAATLQVCMEHAMKDSLAFTFVDAGEVQTMDNAPYEDWAAFRAAVYFPSDWLHTMTFYEWVNIGIPTLVPNNPMYAYAHGTNGQKEWDTSDWKLPTAAGVPCHYSDWQDPACRVYWWFLTDFHALPGVAKFSSVAEFIGALQSQDRLWKQSGQLRQAHLERIGSASSFWRGAVLRALSMGSVSTSRAV